MSLQTATQDPWLFSLILADQAAPHPVLFYLLIQGIFSFVLLEMEISAVTTR